jgi:hypothetical protein
MRQEHFGKDLVVTSIRSSCFDWILPQPFYGHILLLVEAMLTTSSISYRDLNKADACLTQYVFQFERLYGKQHMSYNIHQLLHLTKTVNDWGPLSWNILG